MTLLTRLAGEVGGRLDVVADLAVDVDGTALHLRGDGQRLVLDVEDPSVLRDPARGVDVREVARALESLGLRVEVRSPDGTLAEIGAGVSGAASRLLDAPVRPGRASTSLLPRPVRIGLVAVLAAGLLWLLTRSRRRRG